MKLFIPADTRYRMILKSAVTGMFCLLAGQCIAQLKPQGDSIKVAIEPAYNSVGSVHRLFFGESYRKLWATPVTMKVFHLNQEKGGLKILQRGGGMQTKSLRLQDASGQEWILRTIQKYPEKILPPDLRATIAKDIVQDQISAEHPFSALTVPPLAEVLGVPHAHPQIVYVPDDPAFGEYQKDFANQVFLFEEREPLDAAKSDNTPKTEEKLQDDNDNRVDQKTVLKARLLDMLLGDWDRHEDQWRFERTKDSIGILYEPVPRDRDQVFYNTSGVFPWLVSRHLLMAKFESYGDHIRSINRWNLNARYFDRYFLNGLSEDDWKAQIAYVQSKLTNQVITDAVKTMPAVIYKLCGDEIIKKMIGRRNVLEQQALKYYRFLSYTVEIAGTDKREQFSINNQPDGKVNVTINKIKKDGDIGRVIYQRTFDPDVTSEIRLYGFDGKDVFNVAGNSSLPITIRMIGGGDKDTFTIDSTINSRHNLYIYDQSDEKNKLPSPSQAHIRTSTDTSVNTYNKHSFKYDFLQPLIYGSYNKDYGVQFIGDFIWEQHGFRKEPYSSRQSLLVNYGFGASSLLLKYNGDFKKIFGNTDLVVNVLSKGPHYESYFFGLGNETNYDSGNHKIQYYRNIYNYFDADIRLKHQYGKWIMTAGPAIQYYNGDSKDNTDKFLGIYDQLNPSQHVFSNQFYAGAVASATLDTRNKTFVPTKGVLWDTKLSGATALNLNGHTYGQITSSFSFYLNPDKDSILVIANRTGAGTTIGNASYFQQLQLGGSQNLRGFYFGRFTGKSMAYNNFEVRLKLFNYTSYILPGALGLVGFNDVGRVWSPGEASGKWHEGYGGGIYLIPAQLILVEAVVGFSKDGAYPYISAGFRF